MELAGKTALVTGGDRGIGQAISIALAKKGANVAVNYYTDARSAREVVDALQSLGVKAFEVQADVSDYAQVQDMIGIVVKEFGGLDILINNAGISGKHVKLSEIPIDEWDRLIDVNLKGVFNCCKAAEPYLRKSHGKIVNMSSVAGKMGGTIGSHYAASKAGIIGLTFALASELAPDVTVNAVAPGPVDTDLISPEVKERLSKISLLRRIATPEEIAHSVVFLLENDYVTGEVVDVNGGRYMD
jgi:3-oxoacyl-[acyl-carrier protein] reductase